MSNAFDPERFMRAAAEAEEALSVLHAHHLVFHSMQDCHRAAHSGDLGVVGEDVERPRHYGAEQTLAQKHIPSSLEIVIVGRFLSLLSKSIINLFAFRRAASLGPRAPVRMKGAQKNIDSKSKDTNV